MISYSKQPTVRFLALLGRKGGIDDAFNRPQRLQMFIQTELAQVRFDQRIVDC